MIMFHFLGVSIKSVILSIMFLFIEIFTESDVLKLYFHLLEILFNPLFSTHVHFIEIINQNYVIQESLLNMLCKKS
jgi:hypothetical protein